MITDPRFLDLLDRLRNKQMRKEDYDYLQQVLGALLQADDILLFMRYDDVVQILCPSECYPFYQISKEVFEARMGQVKALRDARIILRGE